MFNGSTIYTKKSKRIVQDSDKNINLNNRLISNLIKTSKINIINAVFEVPHIFSSSSVRKLITSSIVRYLLTIIYQLNKISITNYKIKNHPNILECF